MRPGIGWVEVYQRVNSAPHIVGLCDGIVIPENLFSFVFFTVRDTEQLMVVVEPSRQWCRNGAAPLSKHRSSAAFGFGGFCITCATIADSVIVLHYYVVKMDGSKMQAT